ncbi:MAG: amidohydrolase family protein [Myxococcales bacterium]|nr:amidohydrolase family protein [Myxococcales bacterium]
MPRRVGLLALAAAGLAALWLLGRAGRAPPLAVPPQGTVLAGVTLVHPGAGREPERTLSVRGGRIYRIEPAGPGAGGGPYSGAFVLPGLIDLHVHHPPAWAPGERELYALLFLAHGVTAVRETGSFFGAIEPHRRRIAAGEVAGPRIFSCGPFLDGDPPTWPGARIVTDAASARKALAELAEAGLDCVKVYNGVSEASLAAIHDAAAARNLPVVAHVPRGTGIEQLGGAEVQHLMGLTRSWREVSPERIAWYVETSRRNGALHTPTLVAFAQGAKLTDVESLRDEPASRLVPAHYREILWDPARNPLVLELLRASGGPWAPRVATMQATVRALHAAGVPVLAGSDTGNPFVVPGASLQAELGHLVDAGLSPEEAWLAATRQAAAALGRPALGRLAPGAPADLLVFRDDPTRDLAALATLEAVVAGGRLYPKQALDAALARQRTDFDGPVRATLSRWGARLLVAAMELRRAWVVARQPARE